MRAWPRAAPAAMLALAAGLWVTGGAGGVTAGAGAATPASAPASSSSWPGYHQDRAGTGVAPSVTAVTTRTRAWTSPPLDGDIYGEPLVFAQPVRVATETDTASAPSAPAARRAWAT